MTAQIKRRGSLHRDYFGGAGQSLTFDDADDGPLRVPGFGGFDIPVELPPDRRFAHGFLDWAQDRLTARELAMLDVINRITDEPGWHRRIKDTAEVSRWAAGALAMPGMSQSAWDWCLAELQDKAYKYAATGRVHVLNTASRVCKSDLVAPGLLRRLEDTIERQRQDYGDASVLVDPDLYPLVYGKTRVLSTPSETRIRHREEAPFLSGQGSLAPKHSWRFFQKVGEEEAEDDGDDDGDDDDDDSGANDVDNSIPLPSRPLRWPRFDPTRPWEQRAFRFSPNFQWLPCEVSFGGIEKDTENADDNATIRITSYINNLHPLWHRPLYGVLEACVAASLAPWNDVLVYRDRGRDPRRIHTYGVRWAPDFPADWLADLGVIQCRPSPAYTAVYEKALAYLAQPDDPRAPPASTPTFLSSPAKTLDKFGLSRAVCAKYLRLRHWLHPEPGEAFSYADWAAGHHTGRAVVSGLTSEHRALPPKPDHVFYDDDVSLQDRFSSQGLQVVVELGCLEGGSRSSPWQLCGLLNDHIVATTMVYFASTNVTLDSGALSFRVEADLDPATHVFGDGMARPFADLEPLADIYGLNSSSELHDAAALQELGSAVVMPDGRAVTFANVLQHRIGACTLLDPALPAGGHRRFLRLHLIDPHYRVCSSRHVPPQQQAWWADAGWGRIDWASLGVPAELVALIGAEVWGEVSGKDGENDGPGVGMAEAEAERLRRRMKRERQKRQYRTMQEIEHYSFGHWHNK